MYQKYVTIPDNIWMASQPVSFTVSVSPTDTVSYYDVFINVRNTDSYDFSNLYLFVDITNPAHVTERDTFECPLAMESGKWLGHGLGDIWDNKIRFIEDKRFGKGDYTFTFTQAMRVDKLPAIMDMGLTIEKSPPSRPKTN
jgi:gliding motility-associated lipoprotein GldH